jgi:hypothetical protein
MTPMHADRLTVMTPCENTTWRISTIRRLRTRGATWAAVGTALGISGPAAQGYASRHCPDLVRAVPKHRRRVEPPGDSAKLVRIRELRHAGWSWPAIAEKLGISTHAAWYYGTRYDPSLRLRPKRGA